jgi:hypothetical protein
MEKDLIKQKVETRIYNIRGVQVILDKDLAALYGVTTSRLNEQVRRNLARFPEDFMFILNTEEFKNWMSQNAISNTIKMGMRKKPAVFTELGVAMVSAVLRTEVAIRTSILIMESFVNLRKSSRSGEVIFQRISNINETLLNHSIQIQELYKTIESSLPSKSGIYYNDQIFDAYVFACELIQRAHTSIILIDNYIDETVLLQLSKRKANVSANIYSENISATLRLDLSKHNSQYPKINIKKIKSVHDRFLIIDGKELYHIGASLKDLGKKWFAFSRIDSLLPEILNKID